MSPEADIVIKLVLGVIGAGSGIITWFARNSFEDMKRALSDLTAAVNSSKVDVAVLVARSSDLERRVASIEERLIILEGEARQIREG